MKKLLRIYFGVWLIVISMFWFLNVQEPFLYSLLVFYIILPVLMFTISLFLGKYLNAKFKVIYALIFGFSYMASEFLTFSLLNMVTFSKFNMPELYMILIGFVISYVGLLIGGKYVK